jgi:signal transduction histidine kinase
MYLIYDIIDMNRFQNECFKLEPGRFPLSDVFNELKLLFDQQAVAKNLLFNLQLTEFEPEQVRCVADKKRVLQVFINVLTNAFKYTN